jgi:uncharacterized protein DUF1236
LGVRWTRFNGTAQRDGVFSRRGDRVRTEIAMKKRDPNKFCLKETSRNGSSLAVLSAAVLMAAMSAASVGSASAAEGANTPAAKVQSDKTQGADASTQSADTLTLSDAQRKTAWQDLYMDSLNQNTPPGFDAVVGATVPNTIVIVPVTAQAGSDVPALKPYSFAMVQKKLVIVNPSNRKIADVIAR